MRGIIVGIEGRCAFNQRHLWHRERYRGGLCRHKKPHFRPRRSGNGSQTHSILKHWLFGSQGLVQTEACTQMGSCSCSGMSDTSFGSPEGLRCNPSSAGGNSSTELNSQSTEKRSTLGRYHHFHGHSGMCA